MVGGNLHGTKLERKVKTLLKDVFDFSVNLCFSATHDIHSSEFLVSFPFLVWAFKSLALKVIFMLSHTHTRPLSLASTHLVCTMKDGGGIRSKPSVRH